MDARMTLFMAQAAATMAAVYNFSTSARPEVGGGAYQKDGAVVDAQASGGSEQASGGPAGATSSSRVAGGPGASVLGTRAAPLSVLAAAAEPAAAAEARGCGGGVVAAAAAEPVGARVPAAVGGGFKRGTGDQGDKGAKRPRFHHRTLSALAGVEGRGSDPVGGVFWNEHVESGASIAFAPVNAKYQAKLHNARHAMNDKEDVRPFKQARGALRLLPLLAGPSIFLLAGEAVAGRGVNDLSQSTIARAFEFVSVTTSETQANKAVAELQKLWAWCLQTGKASSAEEVHLQAFEVSDYIKWRGDTIRAHGKDDAAVQNGKTAARTALIWLQDHLFVDVQAAASYVKAFAGKRPPRGDGSSSRHVRPISVRIAAMLEQGCTGELLHVAAAARPFVQALCGAFTMMWMVSLRGAQARRFSFAAPMRGVSDCAISVDKAIADGAQVTAWLVEEGIYGRAFYDVVCAALEGSRQGGFLARASNSPNDPTKASEWHPDNRGLDAKELLNSFRCILVVVCGLTVHEARQYGIKSLRMFLPAVAAARGCSMWATLQLGRWSGCTARDYQWVSQRVLELWKDDLRKNPMPLHYTRDARQEQAIRMVEENVAAVRTFVRRVGLESMPLAGPWGSRVWGRLPAEVPASAESRVQDEEARGPALPFPEEEGEGTAMGAGEELSEEEDVVEEDMGLEQLSLLE